MSKSWTDREQLGVQTEAFQGIRARRLELLEDGREHFRAACKKLRARREQLGIRRQQREGMREQLTTRCDQLGSRYNLERA